MTPALAPSPVASWPATPFHTSAWVAATGVTVDVLETGGGSAHLLAWTPPADGHYYHDPRALLAGEHESRLLPERADAQAALRQALSVGVVTTVSPYGYRGGPSVEPGQSPRALRDLALALVDHARRAGAAMISSHYLYAEDDRDWIAALEALGGISLVMGAHCRMATPWASMEAYHAWLGKGRRSTRSATAWGRVDPGLRWIVHDAPGLPASLQACVSLCRSTRPDPAPAPDGLLERVARGGGVERVILAVLDEAGAPRGALMALRHGDELYPKFVGSRAMRQDYIPLVFNRLTQYALESGVRRINYGGGAHQAKLFRGAQLVEALGVVVFLDPALRSLVEPQARALSQAKRDYFSGLAATWSVRAPPADLAAARSRRHG